MNYMKPDVEVIELVTEVITDDPPMEDISSPF